MAREPGGFAALTAEYGMLPPGGHVLCAFSGGADSMCLLHLLSRRAAQDGFTLSAAHFNHTLRGEESNRDARFAADWCAEHKIPLYPGSADVLTEAKRRGEGVEETARALRYDFLERTAKDIGATGIATAHNADDNIETLLLHLVRGSGLQGLTGIPPRRGNLVRPLLTTSRAEILSYLEENRLPHVEDSTNTDTVYARNKLRHQVMPLLRELNPRLDESLGGAIARLRSDNDYLNARAANAAGEARWQQDDLLIETALVARQPDPIAVRMVRWMFLQMGESQFRSAHLQAVVDLARSAAPSGQVDLPHGLTAYRVYGQLLLTVGGQEPLPPFSPVPLQRSGVTSLPETGWSFLCRSAAAPERPPEDPGHLFLAPERLKGPLVLRPRQTGDRITLPGRGSKSVKKLLIDAKIPRHRRDRIPLLTDDEGPVWLAGFGPDTAHLAPPGASALEIVARREPI